METIKPNTNPEHYQTDLVESFDLGSLTAIILKARFYAKYPDGVEVTTDYNDYKKGDRLDFYEAIESTGDNIVDEVWGEWAKMGAEAHKAQTELLAALNQQHWTEADWDKYREQQAIRQERELAAKARMKLEAAERKAKLAKEALQTINP